MSLVSKEYYEVFEIHTMSRDIVVLTLRINKAGAYQYVNGAGNIRLKIGTLGIFIGTSEDIPDYASFVYDSIYNRVLRVRTTVSFKRIHKRIDAIRDALNHSELAIYINNERLHPYIRGRKYEKGIYIGMEDDNKGVYYHFSNDKDFDREYVQIYAKRKGS